MRIYLDTCCLNRPWDDQSQIRVHLEAEAVLYIVESARLGKLEMVTSDYLLDEILCQPDPVRCADVLELTTVAALHLAPSSALEQRAKALEPFLITGHDALHVIAAEATACEFLLTTDDRLIQRCRKAAISSAIKIQVLNPTGFLPHFPP